MPTPTHTTLTSGSSTTNGASFVSASISPTANRLVYAAILAQGGAATDRMPPSSVSGAGLTFDLVCQVQLGVFTMLTLWRALSASPGAGAVTFDFPTTQDDAAWIIGEWADVLTTGVNGADALGPPAPFSKPAGGLGATILQLLDTTTNPLNATMAINGWADVDTGTNATATAAGGFTEQAEVGAQDVGFGSVIQVQTLQSLGPSPVSWNITDFLGGIAIEVRGEPPNAAYGTKRVPLTKRAQGANRSRGIAEALDVRAWL